MSLSNFALGAEANQLNEHAVPDIFVVVGLPGSGKSTILRQVSLATGLPIASYGEHMLKAAASGGIERDQIRKLPSAMQLTLGQKAALNIRLLEYPLIVDTHALIRSAAGSYVPGLAPSVMATLQPKGLIFVVASAAKIMARRSSDLSRQRDLDEEDAIEEHKQLSLSYIAAISAQWGIPFAIVPNDGEVETACTAMAEALEKFASK